MTLPTVASVARITRAFDTIRGASDNTTAPAAVAVHCADGGRWLPCSTGIRNCRSAVQKWLDAPASIVPANPPSISIDPTSMDSVIVEQAPYSPKNGMCRFRAVNGDDII